jgi:hypothetical protein
MAFRVCNSSRYNALASRSSQDRAGVTARAWVATAWGQRQHQTRPRAAFDIWRAEIAGSPQMNQVRRKAQCRQAETISISGMTDSNTRIAPGSRRATHSRGTRSAGEVGFAAAQDISNTPLIKPAREADRRRIKHGGLLPPSGFGRGWARVLTAAGRGTLALCPARGGISIAK